MFGKGNLDMMFMFVYRDSDSDEGFKNVSDTVTVWLQKVEKCGFNFQLVVDL